jgi:hypothetical protein
MNPASSQKSPLTLISIITIVVLILMPGATADIIIDNTQPQIGDLVHIRIIPALQDQTMVIITPTTTYRFIGGMPESAAFVPENAGKHIIHIVDDNTLVDTATFIVQDNTSRALTAEASTFSVSETSVETGEPVIINAPTKNVQKIIVTTNGREMHYIDDMRPITFIPEEAGALEIALLYTNGTREQIAVSVQGPTNPFPNSNEHIDEAFIGEKGTFVATSTDQPVNAALIWERNGTVIRQTTTAQFEDIDTGTYDLEMRIYGRSLRQIKFKDLHYNDQTTLGVEELDPANIKGTVVPNTIEAFAIDPTALQFSSAAITFTAKGYALYKCVEYNFTTQTCYGAQRKLLDLIPGNEYTITIDAKDPLFSQTGYLSNADFNSDTADWTTLSEGPNAVTFAWLTSDGAQSGVAQMTISGANRDGFGNYYQLFNLTVPSGTTVAGINFSALWRISTYNSQAGTIFLWVQNSARTTTYCQVNASFSATTIWSSINVSAPINCPLGNFTANTNYTFRMRCNLNTGAGGASTEVCLWDNASIVVWYNDTTAPTLQNITHSPEPVNYSDTINITANVTDNIQVHTVLLEVNGTNFTMIPAGGNIYYYDAFSTAKWPMSYQYKIFANDTNNNRITNSSPLLNFTIRDVRPPGITLISPESPHYTPNTSFTAFYTVTDQIMVSNCSLNVSGVIRNSTTSNPIGVTLNLTAPLAGDGTYYWNISCNDTSNNRNVSALYLIVKDTVAPIIFLNTTNASITNASYSFSYTPQDANIKNCSLWGNWSGSWSINQTQNNPTAGSLNFFSAITLSHGAHRWNVQCYDLAGNNAFNNSNFTFYSDTISPNWSGIAIWPASGNTYTPAGRYDFNTTWNDEFIGVDRVILETNFSGVLVNLTPTKVGNTYNHTFVNPAAGEYTYRWYANDTAGNWNSSSRYTYVITKATPIINLTINGSNSNLSVGQNDWINLSGAMITPNQGYLELYLERALVNFSQNYVTNISQLVQEQAYNITLIYNATQNYTFRTETLFARVIDTTPPRVVLGSPANGSILLSSVNFYFTPFDNIDIANCTILLDGNLNTSRDVTSGVESNITIAGIPDGLHNWTVNCSDTTNNSAINTTLKYFTVDTVLPGAFSLSLPLSGNISSNISPTFSWSQTSDANFDNYTLQVDNNIGFSSINYQSSHKPITNRSQQLTLVDQVLWYWRVIAYDYAGNNRTTTTFNYTTDATPPTVLHNLPAQQAHTNNTIMNLSYTASDFTRIANCSLYINGTLNQTNTTIGGLNYFIVSATEGTYNWSVSCYDEATNFGITANRTFTVDTTRPTAFNGTGPANNTITSNTTPTWTWNQTVEMNFANYTVEISDDETFSHINHTLMTTNTVTNTSVVQTPALTDGTWYWRVLAYDRAGNYYLAHPSIVIDTTPPDPFDLIGPANNTQQRNNTPFFFWEETQDKNFKNYTLLVSDVPDFSHVNFSNSTSAVGDTNVTLNILQNITWYWRVVAYDMANNSRNSTHTFVYVADFTLPFVELISPADDAVITTNNVVNFRFNVTDVGDIANCSLYINDTFNRVVNSPEKDTTLTLPTSMNNGFYNWTMRCTDMAGNTGNSTTRNFTINVIIPTQILYESSPGAVSFTPTARVNLSYNKDITESSAAVTASGGVLTTLTNATLTLNGTGMLIFNNTAVNFTGIFDTTRAGDFFITWKLWHINSSGWTLLCQVGDDNTGGVSIDTTTKKTYNGSCTYTRGDYQFLANTNLTLSVNVFKTGGTARVVTHYWENTSGSGVFFKGYKLGTLSAVFSTPTNPAPNETLDFIESCNVTCNDGTCLTTNVYLEFWNGSQWLNISTSGNITLNGSQLNPEGLGNTNTTTMVNFSLYGNLHSINNTLRCATFSTYSDALSLPKNVSIVDRLPPSVYLISPANASAFEPQNVTFQYTPYDVRLANCTLWGNWSGSWQANFTNTTPLNNQINSFPKVALGYGIYAWNVQCYDTVGNYAFNNSNRTLFIAGDLEITSNNITFSTNAPVEGQTIFIYANITNRANKVEQAVNVQFWRGHPAEEGIQIGTTQTVNLQPLNSNLTNVSWEAEIGTHQIYVIVDPPNGTGVIVESDENNNMANHSVFISMWQIYYGNVSGNITLGNRFNDTFLNWAFTNQSGNLFITDTDTSNGIKFLFLQALGRDTAGNNGTQTTDDFVQLDEALNTSNFTDSVNATYTFVGHSARLSEATIFGRAIPNISVSNSSQNFTTGILWDSDDSSNAYFDETEDIVFFTSIVNATWNGYGYAEYEIKVPSRLKKYKASTDTVDFYYEIQ